MADKFSFSRRIRFVTILLTLWVGAVTYRLVDLQILQKATMITDSENLHFSLQEIPARRGEILDTNGKLLAISRKEYTIAGDPSKEEDPEGTAAALAKLLGKKRAWRKRLAIKLSDKNKYFCYIERRVDEQTVAKVRDLKLKHVYFQKEIWRKYSNGWIASHMIGFINQDGSTKEGIELSYNDVMSGTPGEREVMRDGRRRRNGLEDTVIREPVIGANVMLTVDISIQLFVEDALRRGLKTSRARNLTAIVMNPRDGAILAMANMPDFNPNHFSKYSPFQRKNRAVVDVYEPASAFKIVTVASALDSGSISPGDVFFCENGGIQVFDRYIHDNKPFGKLDVARILWHSSNVGAIKIAHTMEPKTFFNYINAFGFGTKTGVDLPAESSGILAQPSEWTMVSSSYLAIGHEISATPLQMLTAACAIANGGLLVKPYVGSAILRQDGTIEDIRPEIRPRRVIREETAVLMAKMLRGVVEHGTAKDARIPGVSVFGKTGTAQRLDRGGYSRDKFNASFVGFFPAEAPRYGIIVVVHDPQGKVHGGEVAAPIFSLIGSQIVQYERATAPENKLHVSMRTPNWPAKKPVGSASERGMPSLIGLGTRDLVRQSRNMGLKLKIHGNGRVIRQTPKPGAPIPRDRICKVVLKEG